MRTLPPRSASRSAGPGRPPRAARPSGPAPVSPAPATSGRCPPSRRPRAPASAAGRPARSRGSGARAGAAAGSGSTKCRSSHGLHGVTASPARGPGRRASIGSSHRGAGADKEATPYSGSSFPRRTRSTGCRPVRSSRPPRRSWAARVPGPLWAFPRRRSADARQRVADQHVDHPVAAEAGPASTRPGGSSRTSPTSAASAPAGTERSRGQRRIGLLGARRTRRACPRWRRRAGRCRGSRRRRPPRRRSGSRSSAMTTPTSAASAISLSTVATPPRVGVAHAVQARPAGVEQRRGQRPQRLRCRCGRRPRCRGPRGRA